MRPLAIVLLLLAMALAPTPAPLHAAPPADPEAILRKANEALLAADSLAYDYEYVATGGDPGRHRGSVHVERRPEGGLRFRADVHVESPTQALSGEPESFRVAFDGSRIWRWSPDGTEVRTGTFSGGGGALASGSRAALFPQLTRAVPLGIEMNQPESITSFGVSGTGDEACHLLHLSFAPGSGYGEQLLCFGVRDHLPRRISVAVPADGGALTAFDLTLSNLRTGADLTALADGLGVPENLPARDVDLFRIGAAAPAWRLQEVGGKALDAAAQAGQVTVLEFWATWCAICKRNLPEVARMSRDYADRPVTIVGVNILESGDPLGYLRAQGLDLRVALEGDEAARAFGIKGTPGVVVIDGRGRLVHRALGARPGRNEALREAVDRSLAELNEASP